MSMILAYFDPGSGSLLVQAIVGGLAGLAVLGKYLWNAFADRFRNPDGTIGRVGKPHSAGSSCETPMAPPDAQ
jgi:hypothetical protein